MTKPVSAKAEVTMEGTVQKVIESKHPDIPDKAEIAIDDCEELYREIRIPNILKDDKGNEAKLKEGAQVEVTVEDGGVFTTPFTATMTYTPSADPIPEGVCAENPREYYNNKDTDLPKALKPDF